VFLLVCGVVTVASPAVYTGDDALVPKNSTLVVKRVPAIGAGLLSRLRQQGHRGGYVRVDNSIIYRLMVVRASSLNEFLSFRAVACNMFQCPCGLPPANSCSGQARGSRAAKASDINSSNIISTGHHSSPDCHNHNSGANSCCGSCGSSSSRTRSSACTRSTSG
jgi:hypothetical protein